MLLQSNHYALRLDAVPCLKTDPNCLRLTPHRLNRPAYQARLFGQGVERTASKTLFAVPRARRDTSSVHVNHDGVPGLGLIEHTAPQEPSRRTAGDP
jgi:hypothetical protein